MTEAGLVGIEGIATLEELSLYDCRGVSNVTSFATSQSLKKLFLGSSAVTDAGLAGIEAIPTLKELSLSFCDNVSNVTKFVSSKSFEEIGPSRHRDTHRRSRIVGK